MQAFPPLDLLTQHITSTNPEIVERFTHQCAQSMPRELIDRITECSPYLYGLIQRYPHIFIQFCEKGAHNTLRHILHELTEQTHKIHTAQSIMKPLRDAKAQAALTIALADISGAWLLEEITTALSNLADFCLNICMDTLLREAHHSSKITLTNLDSPQQDCGIFMLAMGKLGSQSLNYSSDIDLIILFDTDKIHYNGRQSIQHFMTRFAQDIVTLMQERTKEGYVFRTDLRLRPDPSSTPPAVSTTAAIAYYEKVGQNWERAALIKARINAGDSIAGEQFMMAIQPFIWRRHLDFASINDILSIKRQMHRDKASHIQAAGHNIKTGMGGIREIEFFGQIFQLIWGGKRPELRIRGTIDTLRKLQSIEMVSPNIVASLSESYRYLRTAEHRLQMIADEQTQTIPTDADQLERLARFLGYIKTKDFCAELESHLNNVHTLYTTAFQDSGTLSTEGNLVFTGVDHDPDTINTLINMGFSTPETISSAIQDWHKGNRRCTRTHRSRELLTELIPTLLLSLSKTSNPDEAFNRFDEFLSRLPAGVQIFSLFSSNPELLHLIAEILGSAPALGDALSHDPHLLEAALLRDFYAELPTAQILRRTLGEQLHYARNEEDAMLILHRFYKEKIFQGGVQLLKGLTDAATLGIFFSHIADVVIEQIIQSTTRAFEKQYGKITDGALGVIALGKLGTYEMSFHSDLDLIFVYQDTGCAASTGEKPLPTSIYYNRLCQRIISALSTPSRYGKLFDVDTRLRPFGNDGALAVSLSAIDKYYGGSAWIYEKLALTRGRVAYAPPAFHKKLHQLITTHQHSSTAANEVAAAVHDMREKITKQFPTTNPWDIKYAQGGLMDCDFIVQYWIVTHAKNNQDIPAKTVPESLQILLSSPMIPNGYVEKIIHARQFLTTLLFYLRLCNNGNLNETFAADGLKNILVNATQSDNFNHLKQRLIEHEMIVKNILASLGKMPHA